MVGVYGVALCFCFSSPFCRFSLLFSHSPGTRANNCNVLDKGISLRPRLHPPRSKLPERSNFRGACQKKGLLEGVVTVNALTVSWASLTMGDRLKP